MEDFYHTRLLLTIFKRPHFAVMHMKFYSLVNSDQFSTICQLNFQTQNAFQTEEKSTFSICSEAVAQ